MQSHRNFDSPQYESEIITVNSVEFWDGSGVRGESRAESGPKYHPFSTALPQTRWSDPHPGAKWIQSRLGCACQINIFLTPAQLSSWNRWKCCLCLLARHLRGEQPRLALQNSVPPLQVKHRWSYEGETCSDCPNRALPGALPLTPFPRCRSDQFWVWMSQVFLPYLYNNRSGQESYSTTLGTARLRQLRLQEGRWARAHGSAVTGWVVTFLQG